MDIIKIAAVSMVKNESDIIELFIKINSRVFDTFYILDDCSTDGTAEIIKALQSKGFKINYKKLSYGTFNQSEITTSAVRSVANLNTFDYIIPIDVDEFICPPNFFSAPELIASSMSIEDAGRIPWVTYCPNSGGYFNSKAPLYENFRMRRFEPIQYYKVILGNSFAKDCTVSSGNHGAISTRFPSSSSKIISLSLYHVPVRSKEQIIRKAILGSYALALKKNRFFGEGFHWDLMAKKIRDKNYQLNDGELLDFAIHYATQEGDALAGELVEDCPKIGNEDDKIEFRELANINLLKSFDMAISALIDNYK